MTEATKAKKKAKAKSPVQEPAAEEAIVPGDLYKRTQSQIDADKWFHEELAQHAGHGDAYLTHTKAYGFAAPGAFLEVVRKRKDAETKESVPLIAGIYPLKEAALLGGQLAKDKQPHEEIAKQLFEQLAAKRVVKVSEMEGHIGQGSTASVMLPSQQLLSMYFQEMPLMGTVIQHNLTGPATWDVIDSADEYTALLQLTRRSYRPQNTWCVDLVTTKVAHMANSAREMLLKLRAQTQILGSAVSIYTVHPRWLRYYSDGDMRTQQGGKFGVRQAPYLGSGLRPLLFDGPAWAVGVRLGAKVLPGRVFVNSEGDFICSDWCQREVDKGGGIDLITGKNTKHSLATWLAGPAMSRFGAHDPQLAKEHEVRRLSVVSPLQEEKKAIRNQLLRVALKFVNQVWHFNAADLVSLAPNTHIPTEPPTGNDTLRFFARSLPAGRREFGFITTVNIGSKGTKGIGIKFSQDVQGKNTKHAGILRTGLHYSQYALTEGNPARIAQYEIIDEALRKELATALRRLL